MMDNDNNFEHDFDNTIRNGFKEVLKEIPNPDVDASWEKMNARINNNKSNSTKLLAIAASITFLIFVLVTMSQPANAIRALIQETYVRVTGQTLELHQSQDLRDEEKKVIINEPDTVLYNTLTLYKEELAPGLYAPSDQFESNFISAEIQKFGDQVLQVLIHFTFESEHSIFLEQLPKYGEQNTGISIDTDDTTVDYLTINNTDITVFQHKSGTTSISWHTSSASYMFYGNVSMETLLTYARALNLFH
ncbi:MAG: DUF4367 domain-containing protein [Clostridiales bacterium]|nr:DUF4367 domain-containing protein [Clostridiales bacterium]